MALDSHTTHASSPADNECSVQPAHHSTAASRCAGLDMFLSPEPEQTGGLPMALPRANARTLAAIKTAKAGKVTKVALDDL